MQIRTISQIEQMIANRYLSADPINEFQYIKLQNQMLQTIKQTIEKRKYFSNQIVYINGGNNTNGFGNSLLDESMNSSFVDGIMTRDTALDSDNQLASKSKFTQQIQKSSIISALKDVQAHCSQQTFDIVKQHLMSSKIKQTQNLQKVTSKLIQQRDELSSQLLIIKMQKANIQKQLQKYRKIAAGIEDEKKSIKKKVDYILKKQNQVFKLQSSFAFKEKISLQLKKRYQRLVNIYLTNETKFQKIYEELDKLWANIYAKMQSTQCSGGCWRKDVMKRAKQLLTQQRKLIKEQSAHLERQYEVMNIVSNQFKKIFQQPEKNEKSQSNLDATQSQIIVPELNSNKSIKVQENKENKTQNQ